jgi:hypothetical protein
LSCSRAICGHACWIRPPQTLSCTAGLTKDRNLVSDGRVAERYGGGLRYGRRTGKLDDNIWGLGENRVVHKTAKSMRSPNSVQIRVHYYIRHLRSFCRIEICCFSMNFFASSSRLGSFPLDHIPRARLFRPLLLTATMSSKALSLVVIDSFISPSSSGSKSERDLDPTNRERGCHCKRAAESVVRRRCKPRQQNAGEKSSQAFALESCEHWRIWWA